MTKSKLAHRIAPGATVRLEDFDPDDTAGWKRDAAETRIAELATELTELQELLYGAGHQSVLVILQGMDTSGKDGTIRSVLAPVNPQGCDVVAFKAPTDIEVQHDFLWRVHPHAPVHGMLTVFNRSHYEDVLIVRVHNLVPSAQWQQRYTQINHFEQLLTDNGTIILKFFLHISKKEQEERLLARETDPLKSWKLDPADWRERVYWSEYQDAYADALGKCSTDAAPWYVIPADKKWFRNLAISETLVAALRPHAGAWREVLTERGTAQRAAVQTVRANLTKAKK